MAHLKLSSHISCMARSYCPWLPTSSSPSCPSLHTAHGMPEYELKIARVITGVSSENSPRWCL